MNHMETTDLLAVMAAYDRRTVGEADVVAWAAGLDDIRLEDALAAVHKHHRESSEWLDPNHVRRLVKAVRAERIDKAPFLTPPSDLVGSQQQIEWLRAARSAIGDGADPAAFGAAIQPRKPLPSIEGTFRTMDDGERT